MFQRYIGFKKDLKCNRSKWKVSSPKFTGKLITYIIMTYWGMEFTHYSKGFSQSTVHYSDYLEIGIYFCRTPRLVHLSCSTLQYLD